MKNSYNNSLPTKQNNLTKLISYSVFAASFLAGKNAVSQVVYTDIDPDETYDSNGDIFRLNFGNDGIVDFKIHMNNFDDSFYYGSVHVNQVQNFIYARPMSGNAIAGNYGTYSYPYPFALNAGNVIDTKLNFLEGNTQSMVFSINLATGGGYSYQYFNDGYWFGGQTDKYLGFKFTLDGETHYGWLRLDVSSDNTSFTVKDYAYNKTPDMGILAGQTSGGDGIQTNIPASKIQVYAYNNIVHVAVNNLNASQAQIDIYDVTGKRFFSSDLDQTGMNIQLDNVSAGTYYVHILADGETFSKNIVIAK